MNRKQVTVQISSSRVKSEKLLQTDFKSALQELVEMEEDIGAVIQLDSK